MNSGFTLSASNEQFSRFGLSSWSDVAALGSLLLLGIGFLNWGLKLESEINEVRQENTLLRREITELKAQVGNGILPRAEERIRSLENRMDRHEQDE